MVTILWEAGPLASTGASPTGQAALSSPATYLQVTPNDWGGSKGSSLPRTLVQMFHTLDKVLISGLSVARWPSLPLNTAR